MACLSYINDQKNELTKICSKCKTRDLPNCWNSCNDIRIMEIKKEYHKKYCTLLGRSI